MISSRHIPFALGGCLMFFLAVTALPAQNSQPDQAPDPLAGLAPVTVEDCVQAALQNGPGIKTARLNLSSAQATLVQARAQNGLTVGEKAGYTGTNSSTSSNSMNSVASGSLSQGASGGITATSPESSFGVTASQVLPPGATANTATTFGLTGSQTLWDGYLGGRTTGTVKMAEFTFQAAQATEEATTKSVILQAKQAYYTLLGDQKTLLVRQATVKSALSNLTQEQVMFQNQRATDLDVLQMQVTYQQAQLDSTKAFNQVLVDRKTLSIAVGWPLAKEYKAVEETYPVPGAKDATEGVQTALAHRSEIRVLDAELSSARVNLDLQKSNWSPVVTLNGAVNVGQSWASGTNTQNFSIGATVALPPVWDGGMTSAQVQAASDQIGAYQVQKDQTVQTITVTVENDFFGIQDAKDRLDLAATNVQQAQGEYDLMKTKLSLGLETTPDVLTAFAALVTAQVGQEQAKSTYILAILQFNNDLGL